MSLLDSETFESIVCSLFIEDPPIKILLSLNVFEK